MGFKSEAQRKKFLEMVKEGKISQDVFNEWERETDRSRLLPRAPKATKMGTVKKAKVIR